MKALIGLLLVGKLGKFATTGGTMLLSVFAYALVFGWRYAVGFVGLIFVHEMGHFLAAQQRHLDVGAPTFIPFVGAWIQLKEQPMDAETEAYVAMAGPMLGSAGALACYIVGRQSGDAIWLALAYAGFMLNLVNLIPVSPLDGGRVVSVISPKIWLVGLPVLAGLFLWRPSPLLILIGLFAAPQVWAVLKNWRNPDPSYYNAPIKIRVEYAAQYLFLAALLAVMSLEVHEELAGSGG